MTLDQALEIAFRNSPDIRIALDQVEHSRGSMNEAQARFNPTFNAQVSGTEQGPTASFAISGGAPVVIVPPSTGSATLSVVLPLDISHRLAYASDIAQYGFQMQYLAMVSVSEQVILNVKNAYYGLLRACGQRDVAKAAVDAAQVRLANTQERQRAGTKPVFDVTTAQVDLDNLNQELISAQNAVYIAQAALNGALGVNVNYPTQVIGSTVAVKLSSVDIPRQTETAYARRPEVQSAQISVSLNRMNIRLHRAALLPSVNLAGGPTYGFQTTSLSPNSLSWQTTLSLSFPLWDGGVTRAQVREAKADAEGSVDVLEQTKLGVAQQVRTAALNLESSAQRTQSTEGAVTLAVEALRLANVRYGAGIATLVEVTNAESQLTQARFNYVNAQYDYAVALAQLERSTSSQPELGKLQLLAGCSEK
jgi:outer membrane protein TolC